MSCGPQAPGEDPAAEGRRTGQASQAQPALDWALVESEATPLHFEVGGHALPDGLLRRSLLQLRETYAAWGAGSLAWHLLDGGLAPSLLLHARFPERSEAAQAEAEAAAERIRQGENFFALLQEQGTEPPPIMKSPTPFALGARVSAEVAVLEPGAWFGPVPTLKGWEIVYVEARGEGVRSRAGVMLRRLVYPVGDEADQNAARQEWATLPLAGDSALMRVLPRSFVRGRVLDDPLLQ
ncbi:MAG: hypothetical protein CMJ94_15930 [Planctomycetes bacterium]|nr:hypothetical protein [Planctomycetota bacterium]